MDSVESPAPDTLLTEKEAAAWLRVSLRTLQRWRRLGSAPNHAKISNRAVYRTADLEAFVTARRTGSTA